MATPAQLAANRANALLSTGPRSAEGKSASRFNALKHGVDAHTITLPTEDPTAYQNLADAYDAQYTPAGPTERFLLDIMIRADWQKRRLQTLESSLLDKMLAESPDADLLTVILADTPSAKLLARLQRQLAAHERAWFRAHKELTRLAAESTPETTPEPSQPEAPQPPAKPMQIKSPERTQSPAPQTAKCPHHIDEKTGEFRYFVG